MTWLQQEPVAVAAVVQTGLALAVGFGAHISAPQTALILAFTSAVLGLITRSLVTPTAPVPGGKP